MTSSCGRSSLSIRRVHGAAATPYEGLVARLGLRSKKQAYNLLTTAKRTLQRCLREVIGEYEPDEARIDDEIESLLRILSGDGA